MKALKALFLGRLMREKILILAFLVVGVAIWLSSFGGRAQQFSRAFSATGGDLKTQALWLGRSDQIQQAAARAIERLDPKQTLDGIKLSAAITRVATESGLENVTLDDHRDEATTQFVVHTVRMTARRADYATLIKFYQAIQKFSPYIGIEQFALQSEANPANLTASLRLSSVEVVK